MLVHRGLCLFVFAAVSLLCADPSAPQDSTARPVRTIGEWWQAAQQNPSPLIDFDVTADVTFVDPAWRNMWIFAEGTGSFLSISSPSLSVRRGQHIRLHGRFHPTPTLSTDQVEITVLGPSPAINILSTAGDTLNLDRFQHLPVRMEGLVESQVSLDASHIRLGLLSEGHAVETDVVLGPGELVPVLTGAVISAEGIYSGLFDGMKRTGTRLWLQSPGMIKVLSWLSADGRLHLPKNTFAQLASVATGEPVRTAGKLVSAVSGSSFVLENDGLRLVAHSEQHVLPPVGEFVEAIGRLVRNGSDLVLEDALIPAPIIAGTTKNKQTAVLTSLSKWWDITTSGLTEPVEIDTTVDVVFIDPAWKNIWTIDKDGGYFIGIGSKPVNACPGDRIRLKGFARPGDNLTTENLEVTVLDHRPLPAPLPVAGRLNDLNTWRNLYVQVEGYVDSQEKVDDKHLRLQLLSEGLRVETNILLNDKTAPALAGSIVRVDGVYTPTTAPDGTLNSLAIWANSLEAVSDRGPLRESPAFKLPVTKVEQLPSAKIGDWVRLSAEALSQDTGLSVVVSDDTGSVFARALQRAKLAFRDPVELVGRLQREPGRLVLTEALFVPAPKKAVDIATLRVASLTAASQVISLAPDDAAQGLHTRLAGIVTWSNPAARFFYLIDGSGGAKICLPDDVPAPKVGRSVVVEGRTRPGPFAPEVLAFLVHNSDLQQYDLVLPQPRASTLEQALTGLDEARWIELAGYVRAVAPDGPWTRLSLLEPGGEFQARVPPDKKLESLRGAIVKVRGVCAADANARHQLVGIQLWVPDASAIQVDEPAAADPFALPLRTLASLQQFNVLQFTNRPVRIAATVIYHQPEQVLFAVDNAESIRILCHGDRTFLPGDRIEAVGLPGRENSLLVLREAVCRKTGAQAEPTPISLHAASLLDENCDGRLVALDAILTGLVRRGSETRLLLQAGDLNFDALLSGASPHQTLLTGAALRLTGVYELVRDEYGRPRAVVLRLRSPDDLSILSNPPWWTPSRALAFVSILGILLLAGSAWVQALRRRVSVQTREISSQLDTLARLEARHRGIIENASDFIFTLDLEGRLTSFNPAGERLTGYPVGHAVSMNVSELIADEDKQSGLSLLTLSAQADGSASFQCRLKKADGSLVWTDINARLLMENGRAAGILAVGRDFSERKRYEDMLKGARDAAEANARAKSTFLANMSHEIRTPMNGVIGMSNLLLDTKLDPVQQDFAETIRNSAEALLTVLNDILDFSKIEAGKLHFETLDFDLGESVETTLDLLASRAAGKGLELIVFLPPDLPPSVRGDPGRLRQVLLNLVGNAIKFTEHGEVVVSVTIESRSADTVHFRFDVRDTGIGLSPEAQGRLFQPFIQADSSTTRRFGGTGLGLAICKQIVELMGGTIGVSSQQGQGSTFWFTVSLPLTPADLVASLAQPPATRFLRSCRVAIADDNATNRRLLQHYLEAWGADCHQYHDGPSVLAAIEAAAGTHKPFDLVLLDFHMPDMDGLAVAKSLHDKQWIPKGRCLLLTSLDHRNDPAIGDPAVIARMMTKPIRKNELRNAIIAVLAGSNPPVLPSQPEPRQEAEPIARHPPLRVLMAEDNIVNQRVARLQLEKLGHTVDLVGNGLEAIEAIERAPYDFVLMDCQMPEMDGYEATRRIRQAPNDSDIPVIAMTANAMEGDREACLAAGMNDYVSKPMRIQNLVAVIDRLLPLIEKRRTFKSGRDSIAGGI